MPDNHYENARLAAIYDAQCGWSVDRDFYLDLAGPAPLRILELGAGTGLLARAYAGLGHAVTAVDPALSMLGVGKRKMHGQKVEWVHATAELYRSDKRFDLIIMTGHAFQAITGDAQIDNCLTAMAEHLAPGGRAVFESRNPAIDWVARWQGNVQTVKADDGPVVCTTQVSGWDGDLLTFEQIFHFADTTLSSTSTLRFLSSADVLNRLKKAGLDIHALFGDWDCNAFDPKISDEMVFIARPSQGV